MTGTAQAEGERYLRVGLVQALRKEHYGRLCKQEPADQSHFANLLSQGMTWSMVLSLLVWLFVRVELTIWQAAGVVVGLLLLLVLFAALTKRFGTALLVIVALWVAAGVQSFLLAGLSGFLATSFLPFAAVAVGVWTWRALALASGIPFLLPVALVVVFLPLLTQDLWILGDEIGAHLASLALVALAPSLLFLALRYLRIDVHLQLASALEGLRESPDLSDELLSTKSSRELWCNGLAGTSLQPSRAATSLPPASVWSSRTRPIDSWER